MFVTNHPFFKLIHGCNITIISHKDWVNPLFFSEIKEQAKEVSARLVSMRQRLFLHSHALLTVLTLRKIIQELFVVLLDIF